MPSAVQYTIACGVLILSDVAYSLAMLPGALYFQTLEEACTVLTSLQEYRSCTFHICLLAALWTSMPLLALPHKGTTFLGPPVCSSLVLYHARVLSAATSD